MGPEGRLVTLTTAAEMPRATVAPKSEPGPPPADMPAAPAPLGFAPPRRLSVARVRLLMGPLSPSVLDFAAGAAPFFGSTATGSDGWAALRAFGPRGTARAAVPTGAPLPACAPATCAPLAVPTPAPAAAPTAARLVGPWGAHLCRSA